MNEEIKEILDYIINLQEENTKKDNIINEFTHYLENEINFQKVIGRHYELRKSLIKLKALKEGK